MDGACFAPPVSLVPGVANAELFGVAAIIAATGLVFLAIGKILDRFSRRGGAHPETLRAIRDWMLILWVCLSAYGVVAVAGLTSVLSLLTLSGLAGLVLTLALQSTLSNLISGMFLLRDRIVRRGDLIEYSGTKGRVVRISLRNTWVVTDNGSIAVIGNTSLSGGPLINHSAGPRFEELKRAGSEFDTTADPKGSETTGPRARE